MTERETEVNNIKCLGYDGTACNNCNRIRVEKYSDGSRVCEKCTWNQVDEYVIARWI